MACYGSIFFSFLQVIRSLYLSLTKYLLKSIWYNQYFYFVFQVICCRWNHRDLYELLDSPVLQNEDPDCAFFAWEKFGDEFYNVQSVFDMPEKRITFAENNYNENINDVHQQNEERVK